MENHIDNIKEISKIINTYNYCMVKAENKYCIIESNKSDRLIKCNEILICPVGFKKKNYEFGK